MKKMYHMIIMILILSLILCSCSTDSTEKVSNGKSDGFTLFMKRSELTNREDTY